MIKPELTPQEAVNLRNLLDLAVKAGGLAAAELAVPLDAKIRAAAVTYEQDQTLEVAKVIEADRNPVKKGGIFQPTVEPVTDKPDLNGVVLNRAK